MSVIANQRGMTLVEVAIAATVLAMVFLGLASAMRNLLGVLHVASRGKSADSGAP